MFDVCECFTYKNKLSLSSPHASSAVELQPSQARAEPVAQVAHDAYMCGALAIASDLLAVLSDVPHQIHTTLHRNKIESGERVSERGKSER